MNLRAYTSVIATAVAVSVVTLSTVACQGPTEEPSEPAPAASPEPAVVGSSQSALDTHYQQCPYWYGTWGFYSNWGTAMYAGPPIADAECSAWCAQCGEATSSVTNSQPSQLPGISLCICGQY